MIIQNLFFLLILFLYIYSPPLSIISPGILLFVVSLIGLFVFFWKYTYKIIRYRWIALTFAFFVVNLLVAFLTDNSINNFSKISFSQTNTYQQILILVEVFPVALFLSFYGIKKLKYSLIKLMSSLVKIAFLQSIVCLLMLLLPSLRYYILTSILRYNPEDKIFESYLYSVRSFGISDDYLFSLPIFQGIAVVCLLLLWLSKFSKYSYLHLMFILPFLLLSIALNARIGYVAILVFLFFNTFHVLKNSGSIIMSQLSTLIKKTFTISLLLIALYLLYQLFMFSNLGTTITKNYTDIDKILKWNSEIVEDTQLILEGNSEIDKAGNYSNLLREHVHFPSKFEEILFGKSLYVFSQKYSSKASDIGYIQNIYYGGLIYCFILYIPFILLAYVAFKKHNEKDIKVFLLSIFITIIIAHMKGNIFSSNPGYRGAILIFIFVIIESYIYRNRSRGLSGYGKK